MRLFHTRQPTWRWRRKLERRTTAAHQKREASRRCGPFYRAYAHHNQHDTACARSKLGCCASFQKAVCLRACSYLALKAAAGTSHCGCAPNERAPRRCSAILWGIRRPYPVRRSARTQQAQVQRYLPRTANAGVCVLPSHAAAGLAVEAEPGISYHGRAPKERGFSLVWRTCIGQTPTTANAVRRASAAASSAAPPPERQRAPARVGLLHTRQKAWRWRPQLARPTVAARRRREASRLCSVLLWRIKRSQPARHGARAAAASSRAAPPPERQRA